MDFAMMKLDDVLLAPVSAFMDDDDAEAFRDQVLTEIKKMEAAGLVLDISGLPIIDSFLSRVISEIATSAGILGAKCVVVGMRPAVALTLLQMQRPIAGVAHASSLARGLEKLRAMLGEEA
ncbi:MAG: STAS domain-containing protein [Chloroflexi bacterium]|nr:STAS domain-containing protein [Chloroflexota bacterium]